ncbi:hypothetical protein L9F63_003314, partial [Diploptera punctata]
AGRETNFENEIDAVKKNKDIEVNMQDIHCGVLILPGNSPSGSKKTRVNQERLDSKVKRVQNTM